MSDIVERLRETASCADYVVDREIAAEAADTITRLTAENERLRAALEDIASGKFSGIVLPALPPQDPAVNRARAALTNNFNTKENQHG